ncbi:MAG TPA: geranylgeranylglyceryl/heptaprenylglyceryl phosphate synthase, partial [Hymenobacter sp.]
MRLTNLYEALSKRRTRGQKSLAVLLDPDHLDEAGCLRLLELSEVHPVDYFLMGGSLVLSSHQASLIRFIKSRSAVPVLLFPSHSLHLDTEADGILLLSLISGRNPDFLIGQHVIAAPLL